MHTDHKCLVSGSIGGISAQSHIVHHFMILWMHIQAYTPCIHGSLHVFKSTSRGSTRPTVKIISHQLFFLLISRYHLLHRNATDINCKIWMDSWIYSLQASPSNSTDHNGKSTGKLWFYPKLEPRSRNPSMSMQMISLATKVLISPTQNLLPRATWHCPGPRCERPRADALIAAVFSVAEPQVMGFKPWSNSGWFGGIPILGNLGNHHK